MLNTSVSYTNIINEVHKAIMHKTCIVKRNAPGTIRSSDPTDHRRLNTTNPGIFHSKLRKSFNPETAVCLFEILNHKRFDRTFKSNYLIPQHT